MTTPPSRSSRSRASRARDAGLRKISVVTRVFVVGSIAAAGAFTALAAWAQPGRNKTAVGTGSATRVRGGSLVVPTTVGSSPTSTGGTPDTGAPSTTPATVAPATDGNGNGNGNGNNGGYIAPPTTLPDPGYQYTAPVVVSGAS
jgi:hypothetical protein